MEPLDLAAYPRIVFFTGAGLSAASGIPTYRGAGGVWARYDYGSYACQRAFDDDPDRVWDFHDERRRVAAAAAPCEAHRILARAQETLPDATLVTQNIDGLLQRAGAREVIELHGSLWRVRCACPDSPRPNDESPIAERRCPDCGSWRRPDIVWFEDHLPAGPFERAVEAFARCDLVLAIGTSGVVHPAAGLPRAAIHGGARAIEIDPAETATSAWYDTHLRMDASEGLRQLFPTLAD